MKLLIADPFRTLATHGRDERPLRVLVTGPDIGGFSGGIQTFVGLLLRAFSQYSGLQVRLLPVTQGLHDRESWPAKMFRMLKVLPRFMTALKSSDLVHVNSTFDNRSMLRDGVFMALAQLRSRPVVMQFHGGDPRKVRVLRWPVVGRLIEHLLCRCRMVTVLSAAQMSWLQEALPSLRHVRQVSNFIALDKPVERDSDPGRPVRFLFLARLHADKGIREVVQAARFLVYAGASFHLTICGDGPEREWVEKEVSDPELMGCLEYRGVVSGEDKARVLREADVMLLPSKHEAFPFTLLEAMAYGLPLIATPVGAIGEVLAHKVTGYLVPPEDAPSLTLAMCRFVVDRALLQSISWRARELAEQHYSLDCMRQKFGDLYIEAAAERRAGSRDRATVSAS